MSGLSSGAIAQQLTERGGAWSHVTVIRVMERLGLR
jgi:hypothetical protein